MWPEDSSAKSLISPKAWVAMFRRLPAPWRLAPAIPGECHNPRAEDEDGGYVAD